MPCINVTRVTIESHPITMDGKGPTIGQLIDDHLAELAHKMTNLVQTVAVEFEQAEWHAFRERILADTRPIMPGKKLPHTAVRPD